MRQNLLIYTILFNKGGNLSNSKSSTMSKNDKLNALLTINTQISRSKLDEITTESKRINNNLKLYFIINVLSTQSSTADHDDGGEERLLRCFRVKYVASWSPSNSQATNSNNNSSSSSSNYMENCLCMLTNKNVFVFKIVNQEMFEQNVDFDKCLSKCHVIPVSHIEIIELSLVQSYIVLEVVSASSQPPPPPPSSSSLSSAATNVAGQRHTFYKLVTFDIYRTQAILNSLSSKFHIFCCCIILISFKS